MSDIKIHVPQIQIPAESIRGLVDNLKTAQKVISPMGQHVAKVLDTQRQFFSQYQYVGFVKKSDLALTQQAPPKPEQPKKASSQTNGKRKGGRPSNAENDKICFVIIEMFLSYQKDKTLNNIKWLDDAVKKINRRLSDKKCDIKIDARRLDGDKIAGRLFRYLWSVKMKIFAWGYNQDKFERDKEWAEGYIDKYKEYKDSLKK